MSNAIQNRTLPQLTSAITKAQDKAGKSFVEYIETVGGALKEGQELLAARSEGKELTFQGWIKSEFGWGRAQAARLIDAMSTSKAITTSPMGDVKLPDSERQCRELSRLPILDRAEAWAQVVEVAEEKGEAITAKLVREVVEPMTPPKPTPKPVPFDADAMGDRLCDWLRFELDKWPKDKIHEAKHWIKQIIEKDVSVSPAMLVGMKDNSHFHWKDVVGELIDNSFDAGAKRVSVQFGPKKTFCVSYDGSGGDNIERMLTIGDHYNTKATLGRYGVGLKDAACWLWGEMRINTETDKTAHKARIEWGKLSAQTSWNIPDPEAVNITGNTGTRLTFRNIHRSFPDYKKMIEEISYFFAPALWGGCQIVMGFGSKKPIAIAPWTLPEMTNVIEDTFQTRTVCSTSTCQILRMLYITGVAISYTPQRCNRSV